MPNSSRSLQSAFSLLRQTDVQTAVADGSVDKLRAIIDFAPFQRDRRVSVNDQPWFGRGNNFASFNELLAQSFTMAAQSKAASDLDVLFAAAFVCGAHSAVQPNPVGLPNTWRHDITWAPITTSPEVDYTSFLELLGDTSGTGAKTKYTGVWLGELSISGAFGDFINLSYNGGARRAIDSAAAMPAAVSAASLFVISRSIVRLGANPTPVAIPKRWVSFDLTWNQTPEIKDRNGQPAGQEELLCRVDRGDQVLTGSIGLEFEKSFRDFYRDETLISVEIELVSKDTVDSNAKIMKIIIPSIRFDSEAWSEEGRTAILTLTLGDGSILDTGASNEPMKIELTTDIDDTEIFTT